MASRFREPSCLRTSTPSGMSLAACAMHMTRCAMEYTAGHGHDTFMVSTNTVVRAISGDAQQEGFKVSASTAVPVVCRDPSK